MGSNHKLDTDWNKPQKDISYHLKRNADSTEKLVDKINGLDLHTLLNREGMRGGSLDKRIREIVTEMLNK